MKNFEVEYFTDPLCCWSWALEPQLRRLRFLLKGRLHLHYIMGGLLRDWKSYNDQMNDIARPAQMGPLWMQARHISGQPINENIWMKNPIDTSYPACIAVKAAAFQGKIAEEAMLRKLREAVMMYQQNIGMVETIMEIVESLNTDGIIAKNKFQTDFRSDKASLSFKKDLDRTKAAGITRFPTLLITYEGKTVQITGYRPFYEIQKTFYFLEPDIDLKEIIQKEEYIQGWKFLTDRELSEGTDSPDMMAPKETVSSHK